MRHVLGAAWVLGLGILLGGGARADDPPPVAPGQEGLVRSRRDVLVAATDDTTVEQVAVAVGDRVKFGDPLVQLYRSDALLGASLAEIESAIAEVDVDLAKSRRDGQQRIVDLRKKQYDQAHVEGPAGRASPAEVTAAALALEQAKSEAERGDAAFRRARRVADHAKLQMEVARQRLDRRTVRAPFAGVVAEVLVAQGDAVRALRTPLVRLVDPDALDIEVPVRAEEASAWPPGRAVFVEGADGTGRVRSVGPVVDEATQRVTVLVELPSGAALRPGARVLVHLARE